MATEQDYWNQMYANACDQNEVLSLRQQLEHWKANWEHEALESESLRQQLAAKDALIERLRIDFVWFKDRSHKDRMNHRRAILSIQAIDKGLK